VLQQSGQGLQRLVAPVLIEAPGGLRWQGGVYAGPFRLQGDAHGSWSLVEQVPLERYLEGVLPHEIGAGSPPQALAAQAVLARTWSLRNQHRYAADGYHLCVTTQCQVYSDPRQAGVPVRDAIGRTHGLVLSWQGQPIHAVYHASNGGVAAGLDEAWNAAPQPYLRPALDRLTAPADAAALPQASELASLLRGTEGFVGADHPRFRWSRWLDRQQIAQALARQGLQLGQVQRLVVLERGPSGRVTALAIEGSGGRTVLRLDAIRRTLRTLPSTLFVLSQQGPGRWLLQGGGFGHGVGLSQAGAIDLGRRGWSFTRILERYYPGARLQPLPPPAPPALGGDP
jgi:SpoIID/LytB domain protein